MAINTYYNNKATHLDILNGFGDISIISLELQLQELLQFYPITLEFEKFITDHKSIYNVLTHSIDPIGKLTIFRFTDDQNNIYIYVDCDLWGALND